MSKREAGGFEEPQPQPYLLCTFCYFELLGRAQIGLHFIAISVCGGRMKRRK